MSDTRFLTVDWDYIHSALFSIAEKVNHSGIKVQVIVGVLRGGWIPARILSDLLGVPDVGAMEIKFYKGVGERGERPIVSQPLIFNIKDKEVLLIDDVADTGKSLQTGITLVSLLGAKSIHTATIFIKPWSTFRPDFYHAETDKWIVFPWELREVIEEYVKANYKVLPRWPDDAGKIIKDISLKFGLSEEKAEKVLRLMVASKK